MVNNKRVEERVARKPLNADVSGYALTPESRKISANLRIKMVKKYRRMYDWKVIFSVLIPVVLVIIFWNSTLISMFKIFVVMLHEYSHAIGAWLTGGKVISMGIGVDQGGYALTEGGYPVLITSAGYLGSIFFGMIFLWISKFEKINRYFVGLLGIGMIFMTMKYMRNDGTFPIVFGIGFGVIMIMLGFGLASARSYFLKFLGVLTTLYVFYDMRSDLFFNKSLNDAKILQQITGIPAILWSIVWILISSTFLYYFFLTKREKVEYY